MLRCDVANLISEDRKKNGTLKWSDATPMHIVKDLELKKSKKNKSHINKNKEEEKGMFITLRWYVSKQ
jgi:hypothetical protein